MTFWTSSTDDQKLSQIEGRTFNKDEACDVFNLIHWRLFGWGIAMMPKNPRNGCVDFRRKGVKNVQLLSRAIIFSGPPFEDLMKVIEDGRRVSDLWPSYIRDIIRFRIDHKVPMASHEVTSEEHKAFVRGSTDPLWALPSFLSSHGIEATIDDHPPIPVDDLKLMEEAQFGLGTRH